MNDDLIKTLEDTIINIEIGGHRLPAMEDLLEIIIDARDTIEKECLACRELQEELSAMEDELVEAEGARDDYLSLIKNIRTSIEECGL